MGILSVGCQLNLLFYSTVFEYDRVANQEWLVLVAGVDGYLGEDENTVFGGNQHIALLVAGHTVDVDAVARSVATSQKNIHFDIMLRGIIDREIAGGGAQSGEYCVEGDGTGGEPQLYIVVKYWLATCTATENDDEEERKVFDLVSHYLGLRGYRVKGLQDSLAH